MAEKNPKVLSARDAYSRLWNEWLKEHSFSLAITFVLQMNLSSFGRYFVAA